MGCGVPLYDVTDIGIIFCKKKREKGQGKFRLGYSTCIVTLKDTANRKVLLHTKLKIGVTSLNRYTGLFL